MIVNKHANNKTSFKTSQTGELHVFLEMKMFLFFF